MSKGNKFKNLVYNYLTNPNDDEQRRSILIKINRKYHKDIEMFCSLVGLTLQQYENKLNRALQMRTYAEKYHNIRESFYSATAQKDIYYRPHRRTQKKDLTILK